MSAKSQATLISDISAAIISGGRKTKAVNVRALLNDYLDSYANIVDGGQIYQTEVGYASNVTLTQPTSFAYKKWVEDNFVPMGGIGSLAQTLAVGNSTGGNDIELTDADSIVLGTTPKGHIAYNPFLVNPSFYITNAGGTDAISFRDAGGIYVDTTTGVYLPQLTASRLLSLDANNKISNETGTGFLKLNAGVISYDNSTYLTTAAAALAYQPLDSDLTSWAGITRAAGFDTFVDIPSSANLSSLLTDKTGTGVNVFGTSPTFTTDITTPLIIGGSAVGSTIQYKGTSGNGTSTVAAHQFLVGNNGATTAAQVFNSGQVSIGNYASPTNLRLVTIGQDTAYMSFGSLVGTTSTAAIYFNQATPSATNYSIWGTSNATVINADSTVGSVLIRVNNTTVLNQDYNSVTFQPIAKSSLVTNFTFTVPANSNQAASTESPNFRISGNTKTWLTGAITTQRWNYFTANTAAFASPSTIANSYGLYVEAATAGVNATITNNYALGANGSYIFSDGTRSLAYTLAANSILNNTGDTSSQNKTTSGTRSINIQSYAADTNYIDAAGGTFRIRTTTNNQIDIWTNSTLRFTFGTSNVLFSDAYNISFNATTGTKIGTATTEKLSFWNATPIVQPTTAVTAATFVANTSGIANDTATFDGYTIGQVVKALRNVGLLA